MVASTVAVLFPRVTVVTRSFLFCVIYYVLLEWCNVLMHIYVCLLVPLCLRFALRLERRFQASVNRWSSFDDQVIRLFEFYKVEDPKHLFGEGKCPLTHYVLFICNLLPRITYLKPKD